jgi:hypothetical protein
MRIEVTEEHLSKGDRKNPYGCMLSCAVNDHLQEGVLCATYITSMLLISEEGCAYLQTPPYARDIIRRWDDGEDVEPFSVELEIPVRLLKTWEKPE